MKNENILKRIWHSDMILSLIMFVLNAFIVCFTTFRIFYIQHKIFAAIVLTIATLSVLTLIFYAIIKKCGGLHKFASALREQKPVYLAMIFASLIVAFIYVVYELAPLGDYTVLKMDLYHQYGPLFAELYDRIAQGKSLLYSWNSAGGSSFIGNFYNYLSSPFTVLIFWFKKINVIVEAITLIVFAKCIFSAGAFAYYLKSRFKTKDNTIVAFSLLYAFCAYFIAYYWNVMWLDALVLFPFIILGIERIIDSNKPKTYLISLVLVFLTNYYMAYMVCIFSVIYFFVYYISNYEFGALYVPKTYDLPKSSKIRQSRLLGAGIRFAFYSVLAALICAVSLIPIFKILKNSSATTDTFPAEFVKYFDILDYLAAHISGLDPTIRSSGGDVTPNIYCGIVSILLFPLYLMSKKISWKEKLINVLLLAFLFICFNTNYTNYILHGFHFPNDLPYRFSFMYSFIVLVCAYKVFRNIREFNYKTLILVGGSLILLCVIAQKNELKFVGDYAIYASIAFIIVYTFLICATISKKVSKALVGVVLGCAVVAEIFVCDVPKFAFGVEKSDYIADYNDYQEAISQIKAKDKSDYRIEINDVPTELRMSPCWYNYEGISCFSSMASEKCSLMQFRLGNFSNKINSFTYHTQTPVYNMMYDIKYVIDNNNPIKPNTKYYKHLGDTGEDLKTYENKYSSALGYAVKRSLVKNFDVESSINVFENQNEYIKNASGIYDDVFEQVSIQTNGAKNCSVTSCDNDTGDVAYTVYNAAEEEGANLSIKFSADKPGNYYAYLGSRNIESVDVSAPGYNKSRDIGTEPLVMDLGVLKKGDEVTLDATPDIEDTNGTCHFWIYRIDDEAFEKAYNKLCDDGLFNITQKSDTYIKGTVKTQKDEILYTSISYDKGWKAYVDGVEVKPYSLQEAMICVETGEGTHTVEFKYSPPGLKTGLIISCTTLSLIALYFIIKKTVIYAIDKALDKFLDKPEQI